MTPARLFIRLSKKGPDFVSNVHVPFQSLLSFVRTNPLPVHVYAPSSVNAIYLSLTQCKTHHP